MAASASGDYARTRPRASELGVGASLVVIDEGVGKSVTSNTITSDVYAFVFDQKG